MLDWQLAAGSARFHGYGHTHDASALEVERDVGALPIAAIELGDGIAGGGEEAKGEHGGTPLEAYARTHKESERYDFKREDLEAELNEDDLDRREPDTPVVRRRRAPREPTLRR
jgi:hypothetical protein